MKITLLTCFIFFNIVLCFAQKRSVKLDFENKPPVKTWWKANDNVQFDLDTDQAHQKSALSKVCVKVRWDPIHADQQNTWFTDLKMDSLANPSMDSVRKEFGGNIWLSFWCNTGEGDTLWVQPLMLTRGHKGKWASTVRTPVASGKWLLIKFNLATLHYTKWGEGPELPDLNTDLIRCFEVGLLNGNHSPKGFIEARFDDFMISNYEPFPKSAVQ